MWQFFEDLQTHDFHLMPKNLVKKDVFGSFGPLLQPYKLRPTEIRWTLDFNQQI